MFQWITSDEMNSPHRAAPAVHNGADAGELHPNPGLQLRPRVLVVVLPASRQKPRRRQGSHDSKGPPGSVGLTSICCAALCSAGGSATGNTSGLPAVQRYSRA